MSVLFLLISALVLIYLGIGGTTAAAEHVHCDRCGPVPG